MIDSKRQTGMSLTFEVVTVMCVGSLSALISSIAVVLECNEFWRYQLSWSHATAIIHMALGLLVLAFVWYQQGGSPRSLGIRFHFRVLPVSALLFAVYWALETGIHIVVGDLSLGVATSAPERPVPSFAGVPLTITVVFVVMSAAREELLGRAYLITRLEHAGWKTSTAVAFSAGLLVACHLHQGILSALIHIPAFLLGSAYYARYRNVIVLILAHIWYNSLSLLWSHG